MSHSANPLYANVTAQSYNKGFEGGRIVQPFQIAYEDNSSNNSKAHNRPANNVKYLRISPIDGSSAIAKEESIQINDAILDAHTDGLKIVSEDHASRMLSNHIAKGISSTVNSKVQMSNAVDIPSDFIIKSDISTFHESRELIAPRDTIEGTVSFVAAQDDYKSIYGEEGYKIPEYKSVYD
jgi:hypothetical protein